MSTTTAKIKTRRPSKSMRKHTRLVKQETRRNSVPGTVDKKGKRIS